MFAALWLRHDLQLDLIPWRGFVVTSIVAMALQVVFGFTLGPYAIGHMRGSFDEIVDLARTVAAATLVLAIPVLIARGTLIPMSVPFFAGAFALVGMLGLRLLVRQWKTRRGHPAGDAQVVENPARVVVFGAGEGGRVLVRAMTRDRTRAYIPVALVDDDPLKQRLTIEGVRVRGTRAALERVADEYAADTLAIAIPSADSALITDLSARAESAGLRILVLPSVTDMIADPGLGDLRNLDLADLLGRRAITLDTTAIANQISGRKVLVTGAGGSIGSELCRQIKRFGPSALYALDRDESALHAVQLSMSGSGLFESDDSVLVDIRDLDALRVIFTELRPDIVFHAAALKHLPLLEQYPYEAYKSNVIGTANVLTASVEAGVQSIVNISTDKAADPTSMLGYSKRVAERITAGMAAQHPECRMSSVRFGNVLGSRGSVVHAFTAQIERGGPVMVTHPDVERYFMLIPEACQLVLEAAAAAPLALAIDLGDAAPAEGDAAPAAPAG